MPLNMPRPAIVGCGLQSGLIVGGGNVPVMQEFTVSGAGGAVGQTVGFALMKWIGFVPSTLHELVEYLPSATEWRVSVGIWAFGLMVLTVALKMALRVLTGRIAIDAYAPSLPPPRGGWGF